MPSPITRSPLKVSVTEFGTHMSATDPDGNVVVDGARTTSRDPSVPFAVLTTASGQWAIGRRAMGNAPVYDAAGVPVAEIRITGEWKFDIVTGDGTAIPVAGSGAPWHGARFGRFGSARAARWFSKKAFTLKLSDELLARPDHEMLIAVLVNLAREQIRVAAMRASQNSGSPSLPA